MALAAAFGMGWREVIQALQHSTTPEAAVQLSTSLPFACATRSECPPAPVKSLQWREFNCGVCLLSLGAKADIFHNHGIHRDLFTKNPVEFFRGAECGRHAEALKLLFDVG